MLEKALQIALAAHSGQKDRGGQPYILHPIRVMGQVNSYQEKCVALLHDVIEDSSMTIEELDSLFTNRIVIAVDLLTKKEGQNYDEYINAIVKNSIARVVKMADMKDNMDISRLPEVGPEDLARLRKYNHYYKILENN